MIKAEKSSGCDRKMNPKIYTNKVKGMDLSTNSDIEYYHCGKRVTRKATARSYKINLGMTMVVERASERKKSRATATIVKIPAIKKPIVGKTPLEETDQV